MNPSTNFGGGTFLRLIQLHFDRALSPLVSFINKKPQ